ncbi:Uridine diphosphate glucose pyrophosphatase [Trichoplax sp. H2]|nr:Uridine diphosphate glucose pyrophosphatase [Trichoplax sp. H2]|eukprot:RDD37273.1 Uridine diphosphate glucose pyrophosphatase [Trichoplax sp. H2]
MNQIRNVIVGPCGDSAFVKPRRLTFEQKSSPFDTVKVFCRAILHTRRTITFLPPYFPCRQISCREELSHFDARRMNDLNDVQSRFSTLFFMSSTFLKSSQFDAYGISQEVKSIRVYYAIQFERKEKAMGLYHYARQRIHPAVEYYQTSFYFGETIETRISSMPRNFLFPYLHGDEIPSLLNDKDAQPRRELPMEIANNAITYELCSGIVDKDKSLVKIAQDEILEECGYFIPEDKIHRITSGRRVGTSGCKQTYFYAECTDDMIVSSGGGVEAEGEMIDVYYLPLDEAREFIFDDSLIKPAGLIMAFLWFFQYSPNLNGINDFVNAKNK